MLKLIIGITGTFGSGKTTVAKMLKKRNALVIDADRLAKQVADRSEIKEKIVANFGTTDRKKLANIVFSDRKKLQKLNRIVHPELKKEMKKIIRKSNKEIIIIDAPLLIEGQFLDLLDFLILVTCDDKVRRQRLLQKGFGEHETEARTGFQMPDSKKIKYADFVIDNSKTREETERQVEKIWKKITDKR